MFDQIRKLVGQTAVYGMALVASTVGTVILTPLFLHRLVRSEYGMNEILNVLTSALFTILNLGVGTVFIKVYVNDCKSLEERKAMLSSMLVFAAVVGSCLVVLSLGLAPWVSEMLFGSRKYAYLVRIAAAAGGLQLVISMIMQCLRAKQWAAKFVVVNMIQFFSMICLSIYLVGVLGMGVFGIQVSVVICFTMAVVAGLLVLRADLVPRFSPGVLRHVLMLSLPVLPSAIAPWVLNVSDRFFLNHFCGLSATGLYAAGYKVGMMGMYIIITASQYAWPPLFYANSDSKDVARLSAIVLKYYLLALAVGAFVFALFAPEIIRLIAKREYWGAHTIVPYVALAYVFHGVQFYSIPFFVRANRGATLSYIMGGAALLSLLLNLLLVPRYGIAGSVASTVITFGVEMALSIVLADRFFKVPYEYSAMAKALLASAAVYIVFSHITATTLWLFLLKIAALPVFLALLFLLRFFAPKELAAMQTVTGMLARKLHPQLGRAG